MPILDGLMREVLADVDVLGPLVAANDVAPPFDASSVVLVMLSRCTVLSKAHLQTSVRREMISLA